MTFTEREQHEEWVAPTWERVGDLVYAERRRQRITQAELARRAGVSRAWLIDVERGHTSADPQRVMRVLDHLGLEIVVRRRRITDAERAADAALAALLEGE